MLQRLSCLLIAGLISLTPSSFALQDTGEEPAPAEVAQASLEALDAAQLEAEIERLSEAALEADADAGEAVAAAAAAPDDADLAATAEEAEAARDEAVDAFSLAVEVAEARGLDVDEGKVLLVKLRGIDASTLDAGVLTVLIEDWIQQGRTWLVENGPGLIVRVVAFVLIVVLFALLAGLAGRLARKALSTSRLRISDLLRTFFIGLVHKLVVFVGLLFAFRAVGVDLGPVLAGVGIIGFVVGFALQETLGNFAAGIMILLYRPFDVGDLIEGAGATGRVVDLTLVSTTLNTLDNRKVIIPNGAIWGGTITNITARKTRRVDLVVGISYGDDIDKALRVIREELDSLDLVLSDPAPEVAVLGLGDSSVDLRVRPWCNTDDYWQVASDTLHRVKQRLDAEGISIPFPQRDVHMIPSGGAS